MYIDYRMAKALTDLRVEEMRREAEMHRLIRQARGRRAGWGTQPICWLLGQLGRLLVALGRRLQQVATAQPLSLEANHS
jgi:hypothetical protein